MTLSARLCDGLVVGKQIPEALRLLEQAIAAIRFTVRRSPGPLSAVIGWFKTAGARTDGGPSEGHRFRQASMEVTGDDPGILANAAQTLAFFGEDIGSTMALVDRALVLNPSFARGWAISGVLRLWAGQPDVAIEHAEAALRLSPRARVGTSLTVIGARAFPQPAASMRPCQSCSLRSRRIQTSRTRIAISPRVMRIWNGSTTHERS